MLMKNARNMTGLVLILMCLLTMLVIPVISQAADGEELIGRWERFGDGAEGTIVSVSKVENTYEAALEKVTGTLIDLGFKAGEKKWKGITLISPNSYKSTDLFKYEGSDGYEYRDSWMTINDKGVLQVSVSNPADVEVIIGTYQTWRKLNTQDNSIVLQINNPHMIVGGVQKEIDPGKGTCPLISNNRTLVPIRAIVEELGGSVAWNNADQKISVLLGTKAIELWIGNKTTNVNGIEKMTDVAPQIINERTMVPLRYVIDNLGFNVSWDEVSKKVTITH